MSHDVFISHSSIDKNIADAACATLEREGIRCWIAPRDIRPGDSWGSSIIKGIEDSQVMVIIFSTNANASKQVMREVERAVQKDVVVVPFRIDAVKPSADMEYFLSATHWLDAMTPEMDGHFESLASTVKSILNKVSSDGPAAVAATAVNPNPVKPEPVKTKKPEKKSRSMIYGVVALLLVVLVCLFFLVPSGSDEGGEKLDTLVSDGNIRIELPGQAIGAETLDVKVIGMSGDGDYVAIGKSDSQDSSNLQKANVDGEKIVVLEVPDSEGLYEVRYFDAASRKVVARQTLKVSAPEVTLEFVDESLAGTEIDVTWKAPNHKGDFLSIAEKGSDDSKYVSYAYTAKGSPTRIRVPAEEGNYEIRYVSAQSRTAWARRDFVAQAPEASVAVPDSAVAGSDLEVEWSGPALKGDFVTVAEPGGDGNKYVSYKYARDGQKVVLRMPDDAGSYEVRYVSGGSYIIRDSAPIKVTAVEVEIAEVDEVEVGQEFKVEWAGPGYSGDYIGVFKASENEKYLSYRYTRKGDSLRFTAPDEPGTYELRYISGQAKREWAVRSFAVKAVEEESVQ